LFNNQSNKKRKKSISKRQSATMHFPKQRERERDSGCFRNEMTNIERISKKKSIDFNHCLVFKV